MKRKIKLLFSAFIIAAATFCLAFGLVGCKDEKGGDSGSTDNVGETRPASEGLEFALNTDNESYYVSGIGSCTDTEIVIPSEYQNLPVTSIGDRAFNGCSKLTSVILPNSLTSIGDSAFNGCSGLTSITIPESVERIGQLAFFGCNGLTDIAIPDSVKSIGWQAFNSRLEREDLVYYFANWVIFCSMEDYEIAIPEIVLRSGTKGLCDYAFDGCNWLTSITIPDSVKSIGRYSFYRCGGLNSITIPDNVKTLGDGAFYDCSGLTSINIPDSVTSIGLYAFVNCSALTSINFSGTKEQWLAIEKGTDWDENTGAYTIHCTDGDIAKQS